MEYRKALMASMKTDLVKINKCSRYLVPVVAEAIEAAAKGTDQHNKSGTGETTLGGLIKPTINTRAASLVSA